jgi:rhodanese-related sulfurtransferase
LATHIGGFSFGVFMELFLQFVSYNWYWFGLIALLISGLMHYEGKKAGPQISTNELTTLVNKQAGVVLDVRPAAEFKTGHIVDAINIPSTVIATRKAELENKKDTPIVIVCKMGQHSATVGRTLRADGFTQVYRLSGGISEWVASQLPLVKSK